MLNNMFLFIIFCKAHVSVLNINKILKITKILNNFYNVVDFSFSLDSVVSSLIFSFVFS